jgi:hypothetical protein
MQRSTASVSVVHRAIAIGHSGRHSPFSEHALLGSVDCSELRSRKAAVEAAVAKHVEALHVHEGADSVWNGAYEVGALELTAAQKGGRTEAERGEGGQHTSVGKRAASSARGSGWVSAHILVMELSQLSDSEQSELALFGPHSAPLQVPHGSDFEQPSPPRTFPTPALSQNFPHAAH